MENSILVIGTGEVGLSMLHALSEYRKVYQHSFGIAALIKPDQDVIAAFKQSSMRGIDIETLDLQGSPMEELAKVFVKYDTVICCSGFSIGRGMQVKITRAVLMAGVNRYVPWQFGADYDKIGRGSVQPVFDEQRDVRDLLRGQDATKWMIVSTGMITSFLFREDFGVISLEDNVVHALGDWDHSLTLTCCEDIGKLTVEILFHQPAFKNEVVYVSGETATFSKIADDMEKIFNRPFERVLWSQEHLKAALEENPDDLFNRYRLVFTHPGVTWPMEQTFNYRHNIPTISIEQWAKRNLLSEFK